MKKAKLFSALIILIVSLPLASCKKYDEGGSLRKAETNLIHAWQLQSYYLNGADMTSTLTISNYSETYSEGGTYSRSYIDSSSDPKTASGTWSLEEDKSLLKISGPGSFELSEEFSSVSASEYTILKLTKDELWYEFTNGSALHEFHLVHN
jgi:hypothetical protein